MSDKKKYSEAQRRATKKYVERTNAAAQRRWNEAHKGDFKRLAFTMNIEKDGDVIDMVTSQSNRSDYIRRLVREDIARQNAEAKSTEQS